MLSLVGGVICWRVVSDSLNAENTLHAYNLVLDIVAEYIKANGKWPDSWEALAKTPPALTHRVWNWPSDIKEIRRRVRIDFSRQLQEVANTHEDSFDAVEQVGPQYGGNEAAIRELIAIAKQASS